MRRALQAMFLMGVAAWAAGALAQPARAQTGDDLKALAAEIDRVHREGKHVEALVRQRSLAERVERAEIAEAGTAGPKTADSLGSVAWYALFAREFAEALAASERAHGLAPHLLWIDTNRAHALLFLERKSEAEAIYLAHRGGLPHANKETIWEDVIEDDFALFRGAGLVHPAFAEVMTALGIDTSVTKKEIDALNAQVRQLYRQGQYREAVTVAQQYGQLARRRYADDRLPVTNADEWLALLYRTLGRYGEAEQLYTRSLAIREKALGPEHLQVGNTLDGIGQLYQFQGRNREAEPLYKRGLAIREKTLTPDHPQVANSLSNLASLYRDDGRYAEAEPLFLRGLAIREKALGPDHADIAGLLNNLGQLYHYQGRYGEAEAMYRRGLAINEKALGPDHREVANSLNSLALLYRARGHYGEAEPLYKRTIAIVEKALGPDHPDVAAALNNLATLYQSQGRFAESELLFKRSLDIREKMLGRNHPNLALGLNNLALLYQVQGRLNEAEPLLERGLAIVENALGPDHAYVASSLNNLAGLYRAQNRYADAEPLLKRSLAIREKLLGSNHPDVATALNNLAEQNMRQGRYSDAEPLYKRSLAIYETVVGSDHPDVATVLSNLAFLALAQGDLEKAAGTMQRATAIIQRRTGRSVSEGEKGLAGGEAQKKASYFEGLVKTTHRLTGSQDDYARRAAEMFETAQWGQASEAAASLAQMAARSASGSPELAGLVRERQDLVAEWQIADKRLITARGESPVRRNAENEAELSQRLTTIDARLSEIEVRFARDFSDYAALASSRPHSVGDVQAALGDDEALVLFLDTSAYFKSLPEETFVWVVTKRELRWVRSELGTDGLRREVYALRCGLDAALWDDDATSTHCRNLTRAGPQRTDSDAIRLETLPFDASRAHALYKSLFGQFEDLIRGKHLLVVPSGALTQLPFQVLVTAEPKADQPKAIAWLPRSHAVTILPAVSSLKALRAVGKPSAAISSMIGIGNPLLDGNPSQRPWEAEWAKLSREQQVCAGLADPRVAHATRRARSVTRMAVSQGGRTDLEHLRSQPPLPDTANELCAVGKALNLSRDDILLGARATETTLKGMNLAQYRVLHFATHGTIAGEIEGTSEPGLILTPPQQQTETDDGYLSASEVAALKLDADWVILSACNTAAGGARGAEALSGLARAFIYAGARALLVSHWAVDSAATVKLVTAAVGATTRDGKLGRAQALRQAMLGMIDGGDAREMHPTFWAPFIVVGEGASR